MVSLLALSDFWRLSPNSTAQHRFPLGSGGYFLFILLFLLVGIPRTTAQRPPPNTIINFNTYPGFPDLRACGGGCLYNGYDLGPLGYAVGCDTNQCLCAHQGDAIVDLLSCANSACTSATADVNAATSLFLAYCSSYIAAVELAGSPVTTTGSSSANVVGPTVIQTQTIIISTASIEANTITSLISITPTSTRLVRWF
jgi:hypothetical protein